jgi:hypothetical protein
MGQRCSVASYNEQQKQQRATKATTGNKCSHRRACPGHSDADARHKAGHDEWKAALHINAAIHSRIASSKAMQQAHAKRREESFAPFARP